MILCKDCKYFVADNELCTHPLCVRVDMVMGNDKPGYCQAQRLYGPCFRDAKLFEPRETGP